MAPASAFILVGLALQSGALSQSTGSCDVQLVQQLSNSACTAGTSFGCASVEKMYVRRGCRGTFSSGGTQIQCASNDYAYTECDLPVVNCVFTIDNTVHSVQYAYADVPVSGDLLSWGADKSITLPKTNYDYLFITGENLEIGADACQTGGFQISCDNGVHTGSGWEAAGSETLITEMGQVGIWSDPCLSTSGFYLPARPSAPKVWGNSSRYAAFRIRLGGITCPLKWIGGCLNSDEKLITTTDAAGKDACHKLCYANANCHEFAYQPSNQRCALFEFGCTQDTNNSWEHYLMSDCKVPRPTVTNPASTAGDPHVHSLDGDTKDLVSVGHHNLLRLQ